MNKVWTPSGYRQGAFNSLVGKGESIIDFLNGTGTLVTKGKRGVDNQPSSVMSTDNNVIAGNDVDWTNGMKFSDQAAPLTAKLQGYNDITNGMKKFGNKYRLSSLANKTIEIQNRELGKAKQPILDELKSITDRQQAQHETENYVNTMRANCGKDKYYDGKNPFGLDMRNYTTLFPFTGNKYGTANVDMYRTPINPMILEYVPIDYSIGDKAAARMSGISGNTVDGVHYAEGRRMYNPNTNTFEPTVSNSGVYVKPWYDLVHAETSEPFTPATSMTLTNKNYYGGRLDNNNVKNSKRVGEKNATILFGGDGINDSDKIVRPYIAPYLMKYYQNSPISFNPYQKAPGVKFGTNNPTTKAEAADNTNERNRDGYKLKLKDTISNNGRINNWDLAAGRLVPFAMEAGQLLGWMNRKPIGSKTYARNPYESTALNTMASLRYNPYPEIKAQQDAERRAAYGLMNAGGLTGAQRYIGRVAGGIGNMANAAIAYRNAETQNNAYRQAYAQMAGNLGAQDAQRRQAANQFDYDTYAKSHGQWIKGIETHMAGLGRQWQQLFADRIKNRLYNDTLNLYQQDLDNNKRAWMAQYNNKTRKNNAA